MTNYIKNLKTNNIMRILCIKSLYKSTYKGYAFIKGRSYKEIRRDKSFIYLEDEEGNEFNFAFKNNSNDFFYVLKDYFKQ